VQGMAGVLLQPAVGVMGGRNPQIDDECTMLVGLLQPR